MKYVQAELDQEYTDGYGQRIRILSIGVEGFTYKRLDGLMGMWIGPLKSSFVTKLFTQDGTRVLAKVNDAVKNQKVWSVAGWLGWEKAK